MRSKLEANGKSLLRPKTEPCMGGSPGLLVMGGDFVPKVVGSNSSTAYWMDILTYISCENCLFEKTKKMPQEVGVGPLLEKKG